MNLFLISALFLVALDLNKRIYCRNFDLLILEAPCKGKCLYFQIEVSFKDASCLRELTTFSPTIEIYVCTFKSNEMHCEKFCLYLLYRVLTFLMEMNR